MAAESKDVFPYPGRAVDVTWDRRLCIHVQECTRARNEVFVSGRRPWGEPDAAGAETVAEVVRRCPTGALVATRQDGGPPEAPEAENTITVANNGPLYARGDLRVKGAPADMPGIRMRAALCRCGESAAKPFCDNSHEGAGFRDRGAVGEDGEPEAAGGGPLAIEPAVNGPLLLSGNLTIVTGHGRRAWRGTKVALCRCGQSANKPFCDGSHKRVGFTAS